METANSKLETSNSKKGTTTTVWQVEPRFSGKVVRSGTRSAPLARCDKGLRCLIIGRANVKGVNVGNTKCAFLAGKFRMSEKGKWLRIGQICGSAGGQIILYNSAFSRSHKCHAAKHLWRGKNMRAQRIKCTAPGAALTSRSSRRMATASRPKAVPRPTRRTRRATWIATGHARRAT